MSPDSNTSNYISSLMNMKNEKFDTFEQTVNSKIGLTAEDVAKKFITKKKNNIYNNSTRTPINMRKAKNKQIKKNQKAARRKNRK